MNKHLQEQHDIPANKGAYRSTRRKERLNHVARRARDLAEKPLPKSLEWIYALGFKIGILLVLKSFLIIRYMHLSATGFVIVLSQLLIAVTLMVFGVIMQREGSMGDRPTLRYSSWGYGLITVFSFAVCVLKNTQNWEFFSKAASRNIFSDFFNGINKGLGEFGMSVIFWDVDLWTFFCGLMFLLTLLCYNIAFPFSLRLALRKRS